MEYLTHRKSKQNPQKLAESEEGRHPIDKNPESASAKRNQIKVTTGEKHIKGGNKINLNAAAFFSAAARKNREIMVCFIQILSNNFISLPQLHR